MKKSCAGATPAKGNAEYYKDGTIPWIRTQDVRFNEITEVDSFITEKAVEETAAKWIRGELRYCCYFRSNSRKMCNKQNQGNYKSALPQYADCMVKKLYTSMYIIAFAGKQDGLISKKQGARGDLNSSLILGIKIPVPNL